MNQLFLLFVKLLIAMSAFLISACDDKLHNIERAAAAKSSSKVKDTPEVRNMLAAFAKQAHRIELNGCEMLYNGKPFELGMTLERIQKVFGKQDFISNKLYTWKDIGVAFFVDNENEKNSKIAKSMSVFFSTKMREDYDRYKNYDGYLIENKERHQRRPYLLYTKQDFILIEGVPINKERAFGDFISASSFRLDDFYIDNRYYKIVYSCGDAYRQQYSLYTPGVWEYKGYGHLQMKSHPNQDNRNAVVKISIKKIESNDQ